MGPTRVFAEMLSSRQRNHPQIFIAESRDAQAQPPDQPGTRTCCRTSTKFGFAAFGHTRRQALTAGCRAGSDSIMSGEESSGMPCPVFRGDGSI